MFVCFVRAVQGCPDRRMDRLDEKTCKRRQKTWYGFYTEEARHTKSFCRNDLHVIIEECPNIFPTGCTVLFSCQIIRQAIYYSNQGVKRSSRAAQSALFTAEPIEKVADTELAIVSPSPIKRSRTRYFDSRTMLPTGLKKDAIQMYELDELANIQHCLYLCKAGTVVSMESLRVSAINLGVVDYKPMTPKSIAVEDINDLSGRFISCAWNNVMAVIGDRLSWLQSENLFMLKDGDLLIAWMSDGQRYSRGERFFIQLHSNFVKHSANGRLWLSDKAVHVI
eukprot:scaffold57562_cov32-Attheya_sp.AAC.2